VSDAQVGIALNYSAAAPCKDIRLKDMKLVDARNGSAMVTCDNVVGLEGAVCNSTLASS
jgi:hypothetical protein